MSEKLFVKNRKGEKLAVLIDRVKNQKGLAFVMHGLGGFKEQKHIEIFAKAFFDNDYTVVRLDAANTLGESEGKMEDATISNYYNDFEDVINWAKGEEWYEEPFCLSGHSVGGFCSAFYAENNPEKIKAIAPISSTISGELIEKREKYDMKEWKEKGYIISESKSKPGVMKKINFSFIEDLKNHTLFKKIDKITMPVLIIIGENDYPEDQRAFFDKIKAEKEFHVIKEARHNFRKEEELLEIYNIFNNWIKKIGRDIKGRNL